MKCKREIIDAVKLLQKLGPRADPDFQSLIDLRKGNKVFWYQSWYQQIGGLKWMTMFSLESRFMVGVEPLSCLPVQMRRWRSIWRSTSVKTPSRC